MVCERWTNKSTNIRPTCWLFSFQGSKLIRVGYFKRNLNPWIGWENSSYLFPSLPSFLSSSLYPCSQLLNGIILFLGSYSSGDLLIMEGRRQTSLKPPDSLCTKGTIYWFRDRGYRQSLVEKPVFEFVAKASCLVDSAKFTPTRKNIRDPWTLTKVMHTNHADWIQPVLRAWSNQTDLTTIIRHKLHKSNTKFNRACGLWAINKPKLPAM